MKNLCECFAIPAAVFWLAGCGGPNPEVRIQIKDVGDGSYPCIGAAHLELRVVYADGQYTYDKFGEFFDELSSACAFRWFSFPDLPLGKGINVHVNVWDSTDPGTGDEKGMLATGDSEKFTVGTNSADREIEIELSRILGVSRGTLVARNHPEDWGNVAGIHFLSYSLTKVENPRPAPVRNGRIAFDPVKHPVPFPLLISNLPEPTTPTQYELKIEGLDKDETPQRAWIGNATLRIGELSEVELQTS